MSYQTLTFEREGNVAVICVVSPVDDVQKLVRLSDELSDLCIEIADHKEIRVIVVNGFEVSSWEIDLPRSNGNKEQEPRILSISEPIANLDRPVIASINGGTIGLGLELALACDIRIATERSHFGLPQIKIGFIPWDGGTQRLSRLIGRGKALEMILTGEMIDAQEAYRIGLVNQVVPPEELMKVVTNLAEQMASKGPIALRYAKEAIHKGMEMTLEQGLRLEANLYFLLHTTMDRTEGIQSFRNKKTPKFEGK